VQSEMAVLNILSDEDLELETLEANGRELSKASDWMRSDSDLDDDSQLLIANTIPLGTCEKAVNITDK